MLLARADEEEHRFYSLSAQIRKDRKGYYRVLESCQKGGLDITEWMLWYLHALEKALDQSDAMLKLVLRKTRFWEEHREISINARQRVVINKLFEGFEGKLNSSKWARICSCSSDTALRDIQDLIERNILVKEEGGGRSTSYRLADLA